MRATRSGGVILCGGLLVLSACRAAPETTAAVSSVTAQTVASTLTDATTSDGDYISWKEHIIDDEVIDGVPISGGDGLAMADLDLDGFIDVVSVHESDVTYDGVSDGFVRIAFGSNDFTRWHNVTLASGAEAGAAEDVAIGDVNHDGYPDVVVACELAHLIYFQNPGPAARTTRWERVIPPVTVDRGSFIRVFLADLDGDGDLEVVAANKGGQNPARNTTERHPVSWFDPTADPLGGAWIEHELARVSIPINSQPVDLDLDGDVDIVAGSRGERRIFWFENLGGADVAFAEHRIEIDRGETPAVVTGFNMDYVDLSGDGRLDIAVRDSVAGLVWLEQPATFDAPWRAHALGDLRPDVLVGFVAADINDDGRVDFMSGAYSQGPRDTDGQVDADNAVGRLAWFEQSAAAAGGWTRHDVSRRVRGMFDKFLPLDLDDDGDIDFIGTRGNSVPYDGVFWLEQVRSADPLPAFDQARELESQQLGLPRVSP